MAVHKAKADIGRNQIINKRGFLLFWMKEAVQSEQVSVLFLSLFPTREKESYLIEKGKKRQKKTITKLYMRIWKKKETMKEMFKQKQRQY